MYNLFKGGEKMKSVIDELRNISLVDDGSDRDMAIYILEYKETNDITKLRIKELASKTFVSIAAATRLSKRLGMSGFNELKYSIRAEQDRMKKTTEHVYNADLHGYVDSISYCLNETMCELNDEVLDEIALLLHNAKTVNFYGIGTTLIHTSDFADKIMRLNKYTRLSMDPYTQIVHAKMTNEDEINIGVSYSGMTKEVLHTLEEAKSNGGKTILITANDNIEHDYIDSVVHFKEVEATIKNFTIRSRSALFMVLDIIFLRLVNLDEVRYIKLLQNNEYTD